MWKYVQKKPIPKNNSDSNYLISSDNSFSSSSSTSNINLNCDNQIDYENKSFSKNIPKKEHF